ncbi:hypothetical protein [Aeromicrobium sp. UC242_57]|uniref:hypothetical protein n=1 Tax=Aeromicrobium sp. UC242_57 TaxID=3374624 RepID=UPI0037A6092D
MRWGRPSDRAIAADPDAAEKIRGGNLGVAGALIGAVMKEMRAARLTRAGSGG